MSKEIIKYHNDFNRIQLPSFTEQEQNLLFGILTKIKEKPAGENIEITTQELLNFSTEKLASKALGDMLVILRNKFFKADFTILIEDTERDLIGKEIINLFQSFKLWYPKEDVNYRHLLRIELQVNPRFEYLINELTANFTRFELAEFMALSGKYTKTLYRLLKQYCNTGFMRMEWEEFVRILDIPYTRQTDIDQFILKPAMKELTKPRNLFDTERIPFKNLQYKKLKSGGNRVTSIEFYFTPESIEPKIEANIYKKYIGRIFINRGINPNPKSYIIRKIKCKKDPITQQDTIYMELQDIDGNMNKASLPACDFDKKIIKNLSD